MQVAIALLVSPNRDAVFLSLRPDHKPHGGLWELPGGKVESQETLWQGLSRELQEELGIIPTAGELISELDYSYPTYTVYLKTFQVTAWQGELYGREGQVCQWVPIHELANYPMPSGTCRVLQDFHWL